MHATLQGYRGLDYNPIDCLLLRLVTRSWNLLKLIMLLLYVACMYMHVITCTIQDDLLVRVIFGKFACGKLIGGFYIGDFVPRAIEHAQIETKWWILYWQFLHRTANRQY